MIKEIFIRNKEHLNTGTIGHVDHGKTTLSSAITAVLSTQGSTKLKKYDEIDSAPEEKVRGITINTAHLEYETDKCHYAHIDCPGHVDYIKNMITGAAQMDIAILVVSLSDGIMDFTRGHLAICSQIGIRNIIVFLNKFDLLEELDMTNLVDLVKVEVQTLLTKNNYNENTTPFIIGSALKALEFALNNPNLKRGDNIWVDKIFELLDTLDTYIKDSKNTESTEFLLAIEGIFSIEGRGTVVTGKIESGIVNINDTLSILGFGLQKEVTVLDLEMFQKSLTYGIKGDNIGILIRGIEKNEIRKGMVITNSTNIKLYDTFTATVYILPENEGGRHTAIPKGYKPQFYFRTADITGTITDFEPEVLNLGENYIITIKLIYSMPLQLQQSFICREGGKAVLFGKILTFKDSF